MKNIVSPGMNVKRILFAGHNFSFLQPIINYLQSKTEYILLFDKWDDHNKHNLKISLELIESCDIIFCEWCLGNAVWYSHNKKEWQKLIIRAHRQELTLNYIHELKLENIDYFITISPKMYENFSREIEIPNDKMKMLFNIIDDDKFILSNAKDRDYHLGFIGYTPSLKRMDIAITLFEQIWKQNKSYYLFFKGKDPFDYPWLCKRNSEKEYYNNIYKSLKYKSCSKNIIFEPFSNDITDFLSRMGFILSTSDIEGSHQSVAEGMAAGCFPVIRNWQGASGVYPKEYIFNGLDGMRDFILLNNEEKDRIKIRQFARENFSVDNNIEKYKKLFN